MSIAQLEANATDESILCMRHGDTVISKLLWDFCRHHFGFLFKTVVRAYMLNCYTV